MFDLCVIGGGAAGMASAICFKKLRPNASVAIFERLDRVGKKLSITGNSRCNITNTNISEKNYHGANPRFALPALEAFDYEKTKAFFADLGVLFKEEKEGKVYPYSMQASSVVDALRFGLERLGVTVIPNTEITAVKHHENNFRLISQSKDYFCRTVIVAAGGKAGGKIACERGYAILENLGHKSTPLAPAIVQVKTDTTYTKQLKGVKVNATVKVGEKSDIGEVLFCDYGLSGPPILQLSRYMKNGDKILLDLMPEYTEDKLCEIIEARVNMLNTTCAEFFCGMLQKRLGQVVLKMCGFSVNDNAAFSTADIHKIAHTLKNMEFIFFDTNGFANAQVTHGGIETQAFDPDTLMSKKRAGLFACGEVLDIDGDCGGYNLQWAWSSGATSAKGAADYLEGINATDK